MNDSALVVHQAHPVTGEYLGPCQADPDPLVEGNWLIPGMAFVEKPPEPKPGFAVVHVPGSDEVWTQLADHRGTVYLTETGSLRNGRPWDHCQTRSPTSYSQAWATVGMAMIGYSMMSCVWPTLPSPSGFGETRKSTA